MMMVYYERLGPRTYCIERDIANGCFVSRPDLVVDGDAPLNHWQSKLQFRLSTYHIT